MPDADFDRAGFVVGKAVAAVALVGPAVFEPGAASSGWRSPAGASGGSHEAIKPITSRPMLSAETAEAISPTQATLNAA